MFYSLMGERYPDLENTLVQIRVMPKHTTTISLSTAEHRPQVAPSHIVGLIPIATLVMRVWFCPSVTMYLAVAVWEGLNRLRLVARVPLVTIGCTKCRLTVRAYDKRW